MSRSTWTRSLRNRRSYRRFPQARVKRSTTPSLAEAQTIGPSNRRPRASRWIGLGSATSITPSATAEAISSNTSLVLSDDARNLLIVNPWCSFLPGTGPTQVLSAARVAVSNEKRRPALPRTSPPSRLGTRLCASASLPHPKTATHFLHHPLRGCFQSIVHVLERPRRTESFNPNDGAVRSHPTVPQHWVGGFNRQAHAVTSLRNTDS